MAAEIDTYYIHKDENDLVRKADLVSLFTELSEVRDMLKVLIGLNISVALGIVGLSLV